MPRGDLRRSRREPAQVSVAESEARHRALLGALPDGVLLQDLNGAVLLANPRAGRLLGLSLLEEPVPALPGVPGQRRGGGSGVMPTMMDDEEPGEAPRPVIDLRSARLDGVTRISAAALRSGQMQSGFADSEVNAGGFGESPLLQVTSIPLLGDDGLPRAVVSSVSPAADPVPSAPAQLPGGDDIFRRAMQHSPVGIAVAALNGRFLRVNRTLCRMLGYRADELQARALADVVHAQDVDAVRDRIAGLIAGDIDSLRLERRFVGLGGMHLWGTLVVTPIRDSASRPVQLVVQIEDRSDLYQAQSLMTHMTLHDRLTGLPGRPLVLDRVQKALDRVRAGGPLATVMHCDVDHFRVVNDNAGYEDGDEVLIEIGHRLAGALRPGDTAGRLGGDEFVVVCDDLADEAEAGALADRVRAAVRRPLILGGRTLRPTVSIGIRLCGEPETDPLMLLRDAEIACQQAKRGGRDRWDTAGPEVLRTAAERLDLEHELRIAISDGELELHFQPIVGLTGQRVIGREALVRWRHPVRGMMPPVAFLPVAEESGLIVELGAWVLRAAVRAAVTSQEPGYVAVNVSPNQLLRPGLADQVHLVLAASGLEPGRLVLELTESVVLSTAPAAREELERLHALGVRIVVDDFGTGFSALSYLRDLPVSGIKVDRSFTSGLGEDPRCDRIVEALAGLGRGLGIDVVVEGVETEHQAALLAGIGVEHAQGYLFGRPGPSYELLPA
ncbi:EAL domain-containing protein [Kineosporia sp. J2-2]|uniref:EAL domain-containing protein n=1 Tax=Kineosporia corallincola TaxID=2835133 RepID=A0ABS5T9D6_9ACTN|nr:EAL domain-containing protein [Kineosporia corallincola]MBT0767682.1 EAL domain-containing protein [Kineosporia corallincola]